MKEKEIKEKLEKILSIPNKERNLIMAKEYEMDGSFEFACLNYARVGLINKSLEMAKKYEEIDEKQIFNDYDKKVMVLACYAVCCSKKDVIRVATKYNMESSSIQDGIDLSASCVPLRLFNIDKG